MNAAKHDQLPVSHHQEANSADGQLDNSSFEGVLLADWQGLQNEQREKEDQADKPLKVAEAGAIHWWLWVA